MDSAGGNPHLANYVAEELEPCEIRRAIDKAPHLPIVGTSTASIFSGKEKVDPLFLDDIIALHGWDAFSE